MKPIRSHKLGLAFAALGGGAYTLWMLMVAVGLGQPFMDFVFRLHMIAPSWRVASFDVATAVSLVLLTCVTWYVIGWGLGLLWNYFVASRDGIFHHNHPDAPQKSGA